jgi:hypothetical protein
MSKLKMINEVAFSKYQTLRVLSFGDLIEIYIDHVDEEKSTEHLAITPDEFKSLIEALKRVQELIDDTPRLLKQNVEIFEQQIEQGGI